VTKLSDIEAADPVAAMELRRQWKAARGLSPVTGVPNEVACYIERLESGLQSIADNTCCSTCQEAKLVARKALAQPEREAAR